MAKGSGGTRSNGASTGGVVAAPVDEHAAWRAAEGSERYSYDPSKVQFDILMPEKDLDGSWIDGMTTQMLRHKTEYDFYNVQRSMTDGKYNMGRGEYFTSETMTFNQAVNRAVQMAKDSYRYNERIRDSVYSIESEDPKAPSAWIWAELKGDNTVRISVHRFKPMND